MPAAALTALKVWLRAQTALQRAYDRKQKATQFAGPLVHRRAEDVEAGALEDLLLAIER